ncbi:MAG: NAD-dependent epimerase/dehydratase family protein [Clostridiales bacterium]|nr:NAD-dependent epimerase/dehydratase family protein [Clostridiales bacterium]
MAQQKALIIGGNGFIGSNLARMLADKDYTVSSFDIAEPPKRDPRINYIMGDFFDDNVLSGVIKGQDIIYHALSTINPGNSNEKYMMGYGRDFIQTVKLFNMIKDTDTKLIFLSSGGTVYGDQEVQPIKEDSIARPINHYGNVKLCIENTLRVFDIQAKSKMMIARISNPYGPGQDYSKGVGFIDAVIKKTLAGETIEVWGDGEVIRDYIYIDDVCSMLIGLAEYEGTETLFNISSGIGTSQNRILEIVKGIDSGVKFEYKPARSVDVKKIILDNSKIMGTGVNKTLKVLEDGIRSVYDYHKGNMVK